MATCKYHPSLGSFHRFKAVKQFVILYLLLRQLTRDTEYGFALQIQLSPHVERVYMSQPICDTYEEAKEACAKAAIAEGVLNFIKHGNGQVRPPSPKPLPDSPTNEWDGQSSNSTAPLALQTFFDSLPRPFPEKFDSNDAHKINAPGWLHSLIQSARGGKLGMSYFFTSGTTPGRQYIYLALFLYAYHVPLQCTDVSSELTSQKTTRLILLRPSLPSGQMQKLRSPSRQCPAE